MKLLRLLSEGPQPRSRTQTEVRSEARRQRMGQTPGPRSLVKTEMPHSPHSTVTHRPEFWFPCPDPHVQRCQRGGGGTHSDLDDQL